VKIAMAAAHFHGFGVARQGPWNTWVNKGKKGQGLIKASSGHEPALFLCTRQQETNRTPEFATLTLTTLKTYAIKKKVPQPTGPSRNQLTLDAS
jgi:hypothetical protein